MIKIYPKNINKYYGGITIVNKNNRFLARIRGDGQNVRKIFDKKKDAEKWIINKNIELGLSIKNTYYDMGDHYAVDITNTERALIDKDDIDIIEKYIWSCKEGYIARVGHERLEYLHNRVMKHKPGKLTVDHINRKKYDNRKANLRLATNKQQSQNRGLYITNKSGYNGVQKENDGKYIRWRAQWHVDNKIRTKSFSEIKYGKDAFKKALSYRQSMEKLYYG